MCIIEKLRRSDVKAEVLRLRYMHYVAARTVFEL